MSFCVKLVSQNAVWHLSAEFEPVMSSEHIALIHYKIETTYNTTTIKVQLHNYDVRRLTFCTVTGTLLQQDHAMQHHPLIVRPFLFQHFDTTQTTIIKFPPNRRAKTCLC